MAQFRTILFILLIIAEIILATSSPASEEVPPLTWSFGSDPHDDLISNLQDPRLAPQYVRLYEDMMGHNQQPKTIDDREDRVERSGLVKNSTDPHRSNDTCPALRRRRRHITRGEPLEDYLKKPDSNNMTSKQSEQSPQPLNGTSEAPSGLTTVKHASTTISKVTSTTATVPQNTVTPASNTTSKVLSTTAYVNQARVKPSTSMPEVTSITQPTGTSTPPPYTTRENEGRHELTPPVQLIEETDDDE